jgi:hypothetical protein
MLKNILIGIFAAILVVALGTAAYNVVGVNAAGSVPAPLAGNGQGNGGPGNGGNGQGGTGATGTTISNPVGNGNGTGTSALALPASELSADESAALLYMREEEKLARDVYNTLYATWNIPTFQNIAASEQMHMDQIALLLTRYNLTDPAQAPGVFTDAKLQDLYNKLVVQGNLSIGEALKVGGAIEEIDILDLQTRLAATDNADIQQVYNNLMNGSYNHLNAFSRALTNQTGETYVQQYLTPEQYQTILSSGVGNGAGNGSSRPAWAGDGNGKGGGNH